MATQVELSGQSGSTPAFKGGKLYVPNMTNQVQAIGRVAPQNVTVLILGESGTGKELVARAIYQHSRRSHAPFLAINCAAIPETLLESELVCFARRRAQLRQCGQAQVRLLAVE